MIQLQVLSKVLQSGNDDILIENLLGVEHFVGYENEYKFIVDHKDKYGNIPDKATFLAQFPEFEIVDVNESDHYLVDTIQEEYLFTKSVPVMQKMSELLKTDANAAAEYLQSQIGNLQPNYHLGGTDIIAQATTRYDEYLDRKANQHKWYFETGFRELDDIIHGIQRGEEFLYYLQELIKVSLGYLLRCVLMCGRQAIMLDMSALKCQQVV